MGRLPKKGIDYFSHDVNASMMPTLFTVQQSYGNDGYAFWFKLLEYLGTREGLSADFADKKQWLYFLSVAKVDSEKGEAIMSLLASIGAIDEELWNDYRIVWSENFVERATAVYTKRGNPVPQKPSPRGSDSEEPPRDYTPEREEDKPAENDNAQAETGDSIQSGSARTVRFSKPTIEQITEYCAERKNGVDAQNFYDFYESKGWKVGNQPMKDWKACVRTWERRDERRGTPAVKRDSTKYDREE